MVRLVFVVLVLSIVGVVLAAEIGKLAPCGGGCVNSSQCEQFSGSKNCRCSWFSCKMYSRDGDENSMKDLADALANGKYMLTE